MITKADRDNWESYIVGQDDDRDYSESGYVAVVKGDWAAISAYSHCSCYDTWEDLTNDGINEPRWDWQGAQHQKGDER